METTSDTLSMLDALVENALRRGADEADAIMVHQHALSARCRLEKIETVEEQKAGKVGLRFISGRRQAIVSTADLTEASIDALVERASAMAKTVPLDPHCGLAHPAQLNNGAAALDTDEGGRPEVAVLKDRALAAETSALSMSGITNSDGAETSWSRSEFTIVGSNGLRKQRSRSSSVLSVSVVAGTGAEMERDYDYTHAVYASDLLDPQTVGTTAAQRALRRLHPRKKATVQVPVVFDSRVARSLVGHLLTAINGSAIARGTSFLKDRLGQSVFRSSIRIVDDPLRQRGLRSRAFDDEGIPTATRALVDRGILDTWILDLRSSRKLGLATTAHAARSLSGTPSPAATNAYLCPSELSVSDLIRDIREGFYATELIGFGVNNVTGDYSRGASGFWIENGEIAYPVSEITISGNLIDMFASLQPANDLEFNAGTDSPTVRVEGMTVAGQ